jgi:hypothetical protein
LLFVVYGLRFPKVNPKAWFQFIPNLRLNVQFQKPNKKSERGAGSGIPSFGLYI